MKRLILDGAYFLNTSKKYQANKRFFYNLLENDNYKFKKYFDMFMIILIMISVVVLIREVKSHVNDFFLYFNNYIISIIFLIEYLLRLWVSSSVSEIIIKQNEHDTMLGKKFNLFASFMEISRVKLKYITSVRAIIDLLAIVPFFHQLRLLRIFILFRVFKLFRYARSFQTFASVLATKRFEFLTLLMFSSIVVFVSSVLIYVMEANNPNSPIDTLYEAFYWSIVTISTVGYGDITPTTDAGRLVAMFVIIAGIAVLAFTTSLVVSAFTEKLDEIRETKSVDDLKKIKEFYIICGYENIAQELTIKLSKNNNLIVLDEDRERVRQAQKDGFSAFNYDPGSVDSYKKLRIDINTQVKAILCLRESDVENVYTALTVRSFNKDVFLLSLLMNEMNRNKLSFAGVNEILYSKELVGLIAKEFVGKPVAFEVIHALRSEYTSVDIEEIVVTQRMLSNFTLVEQLNNSKYRLILLGIYKQAHKRFFFNPIDSTVLEEGDYLLVIGNSVFIKEFEKYLHTKIQK
ncbi:MAG: ion transporter [Campylobacterota bacterium]|nr:ion transporter [Campylobacterota bacterium]